MRKKVKSTKIVVLTFEVKKQLISILMKSKSRRASNRWHEFHILQTSVWPVCMSIGLLGVAINLVKWASGFGFCSLFEMFLVSIFFLFYWWSDVIRESGEHTINIINGIRMGMVLFILSEVMFFFAFFWGFFHSSLNPSIDLGAMWPPVGFDNMVINPESLPLLNTLLLLSSGLFVTNVHNMANFYSKKKLNMYVLGYEKFQNSKKNQDISRFFRSKWSAVFFRHRAYYSCVITLALAVLFTNIQLYEYSVASFNISDGIYGSCFYLLTGFHGFHVIVGTIFLTVTFLQFFAQATSHKGDTGLECAIWYWHFVDVVWLFLYAFLYCWSWSGIEPKNLSGSSFTESCLVGVSEFKQIGFQQPVTITMQNIVGLHHDIMFWLILIFFIVLSILLSCYIYDKER